MSQRSLLQPASRVRRLIIIPGFLTEPGELSKILSGSILSQMGLTSALDELAWLSDAQAVVDPHVQI